MKLLRRIYQHFFREPMQHVSAGDLPEGFKAAITSHIKLRFGWRAKLAFLFGCELEVTNIVYTENLVGRTQSKSGLWVYDPTASPSCGTAECIVPTPEDLRLAALTAEPPNMFKDRGLPIILSPEAKADARARWGSDESEPQLDCPTGADDVRLQGDVK